MKSVFESRFLIGSYLLSQVLIMKEVPLWVGILCLLMIVLRYYFESSMQRIPPRWMTSLFSVSFAAAVFTIYGSLVDLEAAVVFLSGMAAFKILEYETERDHRFLLLASFFLVPISLLMNFEFWYFPVVVVSFFLLWCAVILPGQSATSAVRVRLAAMLLAASLPMTLILFFVFPRLDGAYWGWGRWREKAQSGFSGQHHPSEASELELSDKTAFRVSFEERPPSRDLYFRGEVASSPTGIDWSRGRARPDVIERSSRETTYKQIFFLDMVGNDWLFTMDFPVRIQSARPVRLGSNGVARVLDFPKGSIRYSAESVMQLAVRPGEISEYLEVPKLSPKFLELSRRLKDESLSRAEQVHRVFRFFAEDGFIYSLKPGILRNLDDFLFEAKKGFCDHYSSVSAVLLRSMGIPSRLVLGYQGGEWVDLGNYLRVAQKDAHSWIEFVDEKGSWQRADPLDGSVVIPADPTLDLLPSVMTGGNGQQKKAGSWGEWRSLVFNAGDWLNFRWTMFWLEYNWEKQRLLFAEYREFLVAIVVFILLGLGFKEGLIAWRRAARELLHRRLSPASRMYRNYLAILQSLNFEIARSLVPGEILNLVAGKDQVLGQEAKEFFGHYQDIVFGAQTLTPERHRAMKSLLRNLAQRRSKIYRRRLVFLPPLSRK